MHYWIFLQEDFIDYNMEVAPWNRSKPGVGQISAASYEDTFIMKLSRFSEDKNWPQPSYKIISRYPKGGGGPTYGCQVKVSLLIFFFSVMC